MFNLKMFNFKNVQIKNVSNFKNCSNLKTFKFLEVQIKPAEKTAKNHHRKQKNRSSINRKTGNKPMHRSLLGRPKKHGRCA
jgi:hypothetical protein